MTRSHRHRVPADRNGSPEQMAGLSSRSHYRRFQVSLLAPRRAIPGEHISGSGGAGHLVGSAIDPRGGTVFLECAHHYGVTADGDRSTKVVVGLRGAHRGRFEVRLLGPHAAAPREHICGAGAGRQLIGRAVDAGCGTGLVVSAHCQRVPADRHGPAELVTCACFRGPDYWRFQIRLLAPRSPASDEHIRRPGIGGPLKGRAVDPGGGAIFSDRPHHHGVAANGHRKAKVVAGLSSGSDGNRFQIGLLTPYAAALGENICRPGGARRQLVRRAVDSQRGAIFLGRAHDNRVAANCHGIAKPVTCLRVSDGSGFQIGLLGNRVDRDRVSRAVLFHFEAQPAGFATEASFQVASLRIGDLQSGVVQRGRSVIVDKGHAASVERDARCQGPPHLEVQGERRGAAVRARRESKAVLQPTGAIDEPFRNHGVPLVGELLHVGTDGSVVDGVLVAGKAVALERQAPVPAAGVGSDVKPVSIEAGHPSLPEVPRPVPAALRKRRLAMSLIFRADARPCGFGEALRSCFRGALVGARRHCCE
jgi:hypothetical protein